MDNCLQNYISIEGQIARTLSDLIDLLTFQNTLWAGTPDYDTRITQIEIDTVPTFVSLGLTRDNLTNFAYVREQIRGLIMGGANSDIAVIRQV